MVIDENTLGPELKRWFSTSILLTDVVDFNDTVAFKIVCEQFQLDYNRYFLNEQSISLDKLLSRTELVGILLYRLSRYYFLSANEIVAQQYALLGRFIAGFEIYYSAHIGSGLKINHGLGTVIGARVVIGNNALIHQGVTFGDKNSGRPVLKDNVTVYAGAKLLGNITVGNNSVIAANCVCFTDVPDDSTAVGMPAKIINKNK
ncbi:MAG: serine acetyltransferase [Bacteroidota bacterium]|jgi:serine O-acetyltransferase|nr:serine acetyltransferase [Bacteroidota bacterium]